MQDQVLSRAQRNDVFQMIRSAGGLDPAEFEWSSVKARGEEIKEVLKHPPTDGRIEFSAWSAGGFWIAWWPNQGRTQSYEGAASWQEAISCIRSWLDAVKEDHEQPDLWREIAKQQLITRAEDRVEYNKPFTAAELVQLRVGLDQIERYILASGPVHDHQKVEVRKRFAYLREAAESGARKIDWLNIFVAQIVALVVQGVLDARIYGAVMSHAATVLNAVYQFGIKLLG